MNKKKYYDAPMYIVDLVKKLNKLREKEENILQQLNDFLTFKSYPKDIDFSQLKHIDDGVAQGQISIEDSEVYD